MSKTLELHGVYETRGGEWTAEVVCVDLDAQVFKCLVIFTNKLTGIKRHAVSKLDGKTGIFEYDLIIPEPEPQWRPWELYEIPVGGILRNKVTGIRHLITTVNPSADLPIEVSARRISIELAYAHYEYFNGTTWQPCGVLE